VEKVEVVNIKAEDGNGHVENSNGDKKQKKQKKAGLANGHTKEEPVVIAESIDVDNSDSTPHTQTQAHTQTKQKKKEV